MAWTDVSRPVPASLDEALGRRRDGVAAMGTEDPRTGSSYGGGGRRRLARSLPPPW